MNRDRVFDFYAKQARHFGSIRPLAPLLAPFPGLDGGKYGHWGNQNEAVWRDDRWNRTALGSVMSGVFRGGGLTVPKAVCVRLGEAGELSTCFDPAVLDFRLIWEGGFVGFGDQRHGFMEGIAMRGTVVETLPAPPALPEGSLYHGFYRHGGRVIFSYRIGGVEMLDSAWVDGGKFRRERGATAGHSLRDLLGGGAPQWPEVLETRGDLGAGKPWAVDTLTLPETNPWNTLFFVGDHDEYRNGDIALCTFTGEVWRVSGVDGTLANLRWRRIATGLHQPLGLVMVDDDPCVLGRDQITRLRDLNGDGEADFYECLASGWTTSPSGHDFVTGLQRDAEGRFHFASSKDGLCRIAPGGKVEVLATGFRNPDGLGLGPDGTLTTTGQEGDWTPASAIYETKRGGFYGYGGPRPGVATQPPLAYLPRGLDNSSGGQCWVESDRWGPLQGQLLHFSYGAGAHFLVLREQIEGQPQGTVVPLAGSFLSGAHRGRFSRRDGQLYVSGMGGWGSYTVGDGCLQRVRFTGGAAQVPVALATRENGILITFSEPLDPVIAGDAENHFAQCWNYRYSAAYGSPEFSVRHPGTPGHDTLAITSAHVLLDGRTLFLEIPQLQTANVVHLHVNMRPGEEQDLFVTAHRLGAPFTGFLGYQAIAKEGHAHAAVAASAAPNAWSSGLPGRAIGIAAAEGLQFSTKELRVKAGERLTLTLTNPDVMPHNWALLTPGSLARVGELANLFVADPRAAVRQYVPETPEALVWTDVAPPATSTTIHFTAPSVPGAYPYVCTFPGHWPLMNGVLRVE